MNKFKDFRLFDFTIDNRNVVEDREEDENDEEETTFKEKKDNAEFIIQMFGINETGKTCSIEVRDFKPFFFIKVPNNWNLSTKTNFLGHIRDCVGSYWADSIISCTIVKKKKLYGFDAQKDHKFVVIKFKNIMAFNKVKNLWYERKKTDGKTEFKLKSKGYLDFNNDKLEIYESHIPPLLRFFHIKNVSPSGWISVPDSKQQMKMLKTTTCDYEYIISTSDIIPLPDKETKVPYKICSFDIEASSSHGDFPVPVKSYKKLADNIIEFIENLNKEGKAYELKEILPKIIRTAFGYDNVDNIDKVYPINQPTIDLLDRLISSWIIHKISKTDKDSVTDEFTIEQMFHKQSNEDDTYEDYNKIDKKVKCDNIIALIENKDISRENKIIEITKTFKRTGFPELEGDKVTFIGSTFVKYGEATPYLNHCIALDTCTEVAGSVIETYNTEKEVLLAWQKLIQRENPDIIIGYNIFGFDYEFMFRRAIETNCVEEFLKLSRNKGEICGSNGHDQLQRKSMWNIEENTIILASGEHDLHFIKMNGRLQVDLYNLFRRDYNLESYKLDSVSGHFIGDNVVKLEYNEGGTIIKSKNLQGLENGNYISFEEIGHSTDYYKDGAKFEVYGVNNVDGTFRIKTEEKPDSSKQIKWSLAKDDIGPQDIFRLTNEGPNERSIVAKYCIQDCNLVQHLLRKIDVITGFIEMAKICSVPMNFLVMRGQGIKLTSYIAKKCREKGYLMPVLEKKLQDGGYEGAIVLDPKCNLYMDSDPVAVCDYSSLYPSSMISENLSHDSKVWTKEYDLQDNLIKETGDKDGNVFIYDNLPEYKYVDVTYDTYKWARKTPSAAAVKEKCGKKICRYAQFPEGKAVMPSVLEELLAARKATKQLIKKAAAEGDEFMEKVYDARQLAYKLTANSLYGQCGAKTSTFYEKDVAASTTATGRKLLIYAKETIEQIYGAGEDAPNGRVSNTKDYGQVLTNAEYVYGDTDSVFFKFNLKDLEGNPITGKKALTITIELAQEAGYLATQYLKGPHDLEYEKTFMPFCLLSKKRYVGVLYELDPNKGKRKSMGIVLKRRDNAPIVKDIYGGVIDILMKEQNIQKSIDFTKNSLKDIVDGKVGMDKLIITKSLRSGYKNPQQIAHKVLADRMGRRDAGNKPKNGDRIPFVYIVTQNKKLQGDKIETPDFIKQNKIKIDYSFYITNQIMKPLQQVFALVLEDIPAFKRKKGLFMNKLAALKDTLSVDKYIKKSNDLRETEVKNLIFEEYLRKCNNSKAGNSMISDFFIMPV